MIIGLPAFNPALVVIHVVPPADNELTDQTDEVLTDQQGTTITSQ
jgi:hypothetical protein